MKTWFRNWIVPSAVVVPYWITRLVLFLLIPVRWWVSSRRAGRAMVLCMEAGAKGWEIVEFKELYASACDYLGKEKVRKIVIERGRNYFPQTVRAVREFHPTHYVYDARTGSQNWLAGLWEAFRIAVVLHVHGVTPICILSDFPMRAWRAQCAMVSAMRGVVITLMSPRVVRYGFPHNRLVAPLPMSFSQTTLKLIEEICRTRTEPVPPTAVFVGSLYEPRTTILRQMKDGLAAKGFTLELKARELGTPKTPDEEYWSRLCNAAMVVTTADQIVVPGTDFTWLPHMIYRYIEVTACGTLLVAQAVPGIERYFTPGKHFVAYSSPSEAVEAMAYYLAHPDERRRIADGGMERARALIRARVYWMSVDIALGKDALT